MRIDVNFGPVQGQFQSGEIALEEYFTGPESTHWLISGNTDHGGLSFEGIDGTEHLPLGRGRIDIALSMWGVKSLGVMLWYWRIGPGGPKHFMSRGDMSRIRQFRRTAHGDLSPLAFYIPFDKAMLAVKEFIASEGALPKSIEWVDADDLPDHTFPEPHDPEFAHIR